MMTLNFQIAVGHRWKHGTGIWEIVALDDDRVTLRNVVNSDRRRCSREWLLERYEYVGDFTLPIGYTIHALGREHFYKTPAGNVHGAPRGVVWSWHDARMKAVEEARGCAG